MLKQTKIVATIGPASENEEILKKMIEEGMNVIRLNFSHGDYSSHAKIIKTVRKLSKEMKTGIGILADLQGPRIRTLVENDIEVKKGEVVIISDNPKSYKLQTTNCKLVGLDWPGIIEKIKVGNNILIQDGLIRLKVIEKNDGLLKAEVIAEGTVENHKGINIPDANLEMGSLTLKDEKDLEFIVKEDIDFIGLSFAGSAIDIFDLRKKIEKIARENKDRPQIVAKIERKEAIKNLKEIINSTDAVMVARGDLGIEMEESEVAILQKEIIKESLKKAKPVIVATQMLISMVNSPMPTRSEVSDVTNAVIDHADAVMLSDETAGGKYPVECIRMMREIIEKTEESPFDDVQNILEIEKPSVYAEFIKGVFEMAQNPQIKAVLAVSLSGHTARLLSHFRLQKPILIATNSAKTFNQLSLAWGIKPYLIDSEIGMDEFIDRIADKGKKEKILSSGDKVAVILGKGPNNEKTRIVGTKEIN
jgi:pyruvate kinase